MSGCFFFWNTVYYSLLAVWISNNDSIWHRFRDIITFTEYVTGCDLEKSFVFEKIVEITSHGRFPIYVLAYRR